jgi:hypothetical protein
MAGMTNLIRVILSLVVALTVFVVTFLAVFMPMLISDMHYAPHDGQGGMGGFFLGLPLGTLSAFVAGITYFIQAKRRNWFSVSK